MIGSCSYGTTNVPPSPRVSTNRDGPRSAPPQFGSSGPFPADKVSSIRRVIARRVHDDLGISARPSVHRSQKSASGRTRRRWRAARCTAHAMARPGPHVSDRRTDNRWCSSLVLEPGGDVENTGRSDWASPGRKRLSDGIQRAVLPGADGRGEAWTRNAGRGQSARRDRAKASAREDHVHAATIIQDEGQALPERGPRRSETRTRQAERFQAPRRNYEWHSSHKEDGNCVLRL